MTDVPSVNVVELLVMLVATNNLAYCEDRSRSQAQNDKIAMLDFFAELPQVCNFSF